MLCAQSCLFVTSRTVAHQASLPTGFSRQEYWSGLPFPSLADLPDPGIEPVSLASPALPGEFFTTLILRIPWRLVLLDIDFRQPVIFPQHFEDRLSLSSGTNCCQGDV